MMLFGYTIDRSAAKAGLVPMELDGPFFHAGSKSGVLVLHGIGGTPANVRATADRLAAEGHTVCAPLLPGHGKTVEDLAASGERDWIFCAKSGLRALREAGCSRLYAVGLSLGGLISGLLAEEEDLAGCVMICPPVRMKGYLRFAGAVSGLFPYVQYGDKKADRALKDAYHSMLPGMATAKMRDLGRMGKRFSGEIGRIRCPLLAIEAGLDNKVDPDTFRILKEGVPGMEYRLFPDAAHGCTYGEKREEVAACVADWIRAREAEYGRT